MRRQVAFILPLVLAAGACGREPVAPEPRMAPTAGAALQQRGHVEGTGILLESVTGLTVPLLGLDLGDVEIRQAVIKEFGVVEDIAGNIIGVEATGFVDLFGTALGTEVVRQEFTTGVGVISKRGGQCDIVGLDLAPIKLDALAGLVSVDVPAADVTARGNGALGSLLCTLGQLVQGPVDQITRGVRGLVNAINNLIP